MNKTDCKKMHYKLQRQSTSLHVCQKTYYIVNLKLFSTAIPAEGGSDVTKCSFGNGGTDTYKDKNKKREQISSCFVDNKQFGECNPENKFGYRLGEPCILIKLNRVRMRTMRVRNILKINMSTQLWGNKQLNFGL